LGLEKQCHANRSPDNEGAGWEECRERRQVGNSPPVVPSCGKYWAGAVDGTENESDRPEADQIQQNKRPIDDVHAGQ